MRDLPDPDDVSRDDRPAEDTRRRRRAANTEERSSRIPPHDLDAERALLGAAMLSPAALEVLTTRVTPNDFYSPAHANVADAMGRIYVDAVTAGNLGNQSPADPVTIAAELRREGLLDTIGGPHVLIDLQAGTPAIGNAARYAGVVHDFATLRRLIGAAGEIAETAYGELGWRGDPSDSAHASVIAAQEMLANVAAQNGSRSYSTLDFGDVDLLLSGALPKVDPVFLTRNDGQPVLYAGRMHLFHGEPGSGKTWAALKAVVEVLTLGGAAAYLDYEDTFAGIVGRSLALGARPDDVRDRFVYVKQDGPFGSSEKIELGGKLAALNPDLIVLDGVAEALSRDGFSEDKATEVVQWIEKLPRWLARTGAAVLMLDHVAKDKETRGRWARGSSAKLAAIDGSAFEVVALVPFSRHRAGKSALRTAKDRHGTFDVGSVASIVTITPHADGERVVVELEPPEIATSSTADPWKPTVLMAKVSEELERAVAPMSARALRDLVRADKPKLVTEAIARLVSEGWVREYRIGSSKYLRLERPYREGGTPPPADPALFDAPEPEGPRVVVPGPWPQHDNDPTDPGPTEPDPDEGDQ